MIRIEFLLTDNHMFCFVLVLGIHMCIRAASHLIFISITYLFDRCVKYVDYFMVGERRRFLFTS